MSLRLVSQCHFLVGGFRPISIFHLILGFIQCFKFSNGPGESAEVIAPTHAKASELQDIAHRQVGGGTCFRKAFAECRSLMNRSSRTQDGRSAPDLWEKTSQFMSWSLFFCCQIGKSDRSKRVIHVDTIQCQHSIVHASSLSRFFAPVSWVPFWFTYKTRNIGGQNACSTWNFRRRDELHRNSSCSSLMVVQPSRIPNSLPCWRIMAAGSNVWPVWPWVNTQTDGLCRPSEPNSRSKASTSSCGVLTARRPWSQLSRKLLAVVPFIAGRFLDELSSFFSLAFVQKWVPQPLKTQVRGCLTFEETIEIKVSLNGKTCPI